MFELEDPIRVTRAVPYNLRNLLEAVVKSPLDGPYPKVIEDWNADREGIDIVDPDLALGQRAIVSTFLIG